MSSISQTAIKAACYRAYHWLCDKPRIFDDALALQMVGEAEYAAFIKQNTEGFKAAAAEFAASFQSDQTILAFIMQAMAAPALTFSRARYAEDNLEKALKAGVKQYVILGAGLDTFAWRRADLLDQLEVFEVDQPGTQLYKVNRITELGFQKPEKLHYIQADFTADNLGQILRDSGYDPGKSSFFSLLGVSYYLPSEAMFRMLKAISGIASSESEIVLDYLEEDAFDYNKAADRIKALLIMAQNAGETMNMGFNPNTIQEELSGIGLKTAEHLGPKDVQQRYFHDRNDNYYACEQAHLITLVAKPLICKKEQGEISK